MSLGSSRGMALLSVLWITGLLAVMAASFASSTRTEARLAHNLMENAKAEALADGGVERAVLGLFELDPQIAWRPGAVYAIALGEGEVRIEIEDEDGKIDLNGAPLELIAGLLAVLGLAPDQAQAMAERIGDYRDYDDEPAAQGAEDPDYFAAGLMAGAADREFATVAELLGVLGMTQALYEGMRPFVTVYSGGEGVDLTRAPRAVLEALPGMTPALIEQLQSAGPDFDLFEAVEDESLLEQIELYFLPTRDVVFTVRALARTAGGGIFVREAVIELGGTDERPYVVHAWRRGALPTGLAG